VAAIGKYGPYLRHNQKFYSLGQDDDPLTVELDRSIEIILAKRKDEAEKIIKTFEENPEVIVQNGPYGPYIKVGKKNVRIPKGKEPAGLTLEECLELAEKSPERKSKKSRRKKS